MIRYPNIIGKNDSQKLEQMKSYLHQLADELNFRLEQNAGASAASATVVASASFKPTKTEEAISNFNEIKGLIIKSADIVDSYSEQISETLKGEFVAVSDFGTYTEDTLTELGISSQDIQATITKVESIDGEIKNAVQSEVKQTAESITLSVENGETTAQIKLQIGGEEKTDEIAMTGVVSFSNLTDGTTEISGSNIKTGTINADLIDVDELFSKNITTTGKFTNTAKVFLEPGAEEVETIKNHILGSATIPSSRIPLYDFNNSGTVTISDLNLAQAAAMGKSSLASWSGAVESTVTIEIDMSNLDKAIRLYGTNMWGRLVDVYISVNSMNSTFAPREYVDTSFAPAGFGLGETVKWIYAPDTLANHIHSGFYSWASGVSDAPFTAGSMIVIKRSDAYAYQLAFRDDVTAPTCALRKLTNTTWSEWVDCSPVVALPVNRGGTGATDAPTARTNLGITPTNIGAIAQASNYYSSGKSADDLGTADSLALIPCNATTNPELFAIVKTTFAYVLTVYYSNINQRAQVAISYAANPPKMAFRTLYGGVWTPWTELSSGMLSGLDTGSVSIASGTTKEYSDSKSKFYNVTVQIGSTAYRHTFVVDRSAVNNATNKQIGYYSDAMGNQMNLVVSIKDSTTVTFKPSGCNIVHISGYY